MSYSNSIITTAARKKMVQARAGAITLPAVTYIAFGSGGVDSSGDVIEPTEDQTELNNELTRKEIESYSFTDDTTCRYVVTLEEEELGGESISELALVDSEGDLVGIKNFSSKVKDDDLQMTFTVDDVF